MLTLSTAFLQLQAAWNKVMLSARILVLPHLFLSPSFSNELTLYFTFHILQEIRITQHQLNNVLHTLSSASCVQMTVMGTIKAWRQIITAYVCNYSSNKVSSWLFSIKACGLVAKLLYFFLLFYILSFSYCISDWEKCLYYNIHWRYLQNRGREIYRVTTIKSKPCSQNFGGILTMEDFQLSFYLIWKINDIEDVTRWEKIIKITQDAHNSLFIHTPPGTLRA